MVAVQTPEWKIQCRNHFWPWLFSTPNYDPLAIQKDANKRPFVADRRHRWLWIPAEDSRGASIMLSWQQTPNGEGCLHVSIMFFRILRRPSFDAVPEYGHDADNAETWVGGAEVAQIDDYYAVLAAVVPGVTLFIGELSNGAQHFVAVGRDRVEDEVRRALSEAKE